MIMHSKKGFGMKEIIEYNGEMLAFIIRGSYVPNKTTFVTPQTFKQQVGFIVYESGENIQPHTHRNITRTIEGSAEVLVLREGRVRVDFYSQKKVYVESRDIYPNDILVLLWGGHGFHFYERGVFLEIKQGPYVGDHEKERFQRRDT